eukprot:GFUD01003051.1.p1 GENE.GFUD01003051.1~~GFUD01003051.1.p1  ORF type:complete len:322 (+),score=90.05 GFUD01003051.1:261-1226(+)
MGRARLLLTFCLFGLAACATPDVFGDYFDEGVKSVDVSQDLAIRACVKPATNLVTKLSVATRKCLGDDNKFDWEDFTELNQGSADQTGLTVGLQNAEACFYGEMRWRVGEAVKKDVVLADFANLVANVQASFVADINQCASWNGVISSSRRRRSADDEESLDDNMKAPDYEQENASEGGLLGWVQSLVRSKRQAPALKRKTPSKAGPKQPNQRKAPPNAGPKQPLQGKARPKAGPNQPLQRKAPPKALKRKIVVNGKNGGKGRKIIKKKRILKKKPKTPATNLKSGSPIREINAQTYNKLWCFDLAVAQALKKCVEEKIKN